MTDSGRRRPDSYRRGLHRLLLSPWPIPLGDGDAQFGRTAGEQRREGEQHQLLDRVGDRADDTSPLRFLIVNPGWTVHDDGCAEGGFGVSLRLLAPVPANLNHERLARARNSCEVRSSYAIHLEAMIGHRRERHQVDERRDDSTSFRRIWVVLHACGKCEPIVASAASDA